ncbi:MAG: RusA family crossover junction endodeoxyribonuclease [Synergistaceae bacterium]|nr:RusA family crossover junction endodeoxyribonuclease [Synergistaceae bacterium]
MLAQFLLEGLPPTVNTFYLRTARTVCRKPHVRLWQLKTTAQLAAEWHNKPPISLPLELSIVFETSNRRKWDIDNRIKPLQDCLERAGIILNDRQVESLHVRRIYGTKDTTCLTLEEYRQ